MVCTVCVVTVNARTGGLMPFPSKYARNSSLWNRSIYQQLREKDTCQGLTERSSHFPLLQGLAQPPNAYRLAFLVGRLV